MSKSVKEYKESIIKAGHEAVEQLIKVAQEQIIKETPDDDLAADRLKNAAATKKLAIFDAFEILNRIQEEEQMINDIDKKGDSKKQQNFKGFAEGRAKFE